MSFTCTLICFLYFFSNLLKFPLSLLLVTCTTAEDLLVKITLIVFLLAGLVFYIDLTVEVFEAKNMVKVERHRVVVIGTAVHTTFLVFEGRGKLVLDELFLLQFVDVFV